jgi:hypothetical protein
MTAPPPRTSLPEYAHPPIVAATLGVFFRAPLELGSTTLAEFQQRLGPEWVGEWTAVTAATVSPNECGLLAAGQQLQNVLGDRILRVSPLHFGFTWLGTADGRYPRYENLRDGFLAVWDLWLDRNAAAGQPGKWGVSYLNQIPQGTVWQTTADFSFFKLNPSPPWAERLGMARWMLQLADLPDGLTVDWSLDVRSGQMPCIWLRLLATGAIAAEPGSLLDGMDSGRVAIVQSFSELVSPAANAYWGLRRREK